MSCGFVNWKFFIIYDRNAVVTPIVFHFQHVSFLNLIQVSNFAMLNAGSKLNEHIPELVTQKRNVKQIKTHLKFKPIRESVEAKFSSFNFPNSLPRDIWRFL